MTPYLQQSFNSDRFQPFKKKKVEDTTSVYSAKPIQSLSSGGVKYDDGSSTTPFRLPAVDTPVKKPAPQPSASDNYLSETSRIAQEEQKFLEDRAKSEEGMANRIYDRKIKSAQDMAPLAQQSYDQFKNDTTAGAATAKANAEETWGNDQRLLAQTRRETAGRLGAKFAAQNTSDSFGAGSAQMADTNLESDFNRQTAQGLRQKSQNLTEIDQKANSLIAQEGIKLKQSLLTIQNTIFTSEEEKVAAIKKAYDDAKAGILGIRENLANMKYQKALSDQQSETAGLSAGFIKTGVPETAADFVFRMKNPTGFATYGSSGSTNNNQNKALTMVNNILGGNIGGISGAVRTGNIPVVGQMSGSATTQADYDGLKALLALAERGQLKGSGQVSDFETKMLEKAALAGLNQNLPTDEFKRRLELLRNDLMSGGATDSVARTVTMIAPDGNTYSVDPSEVQMATANGWRTR